MNIDKALSNLVRGVSVKSLLIPFVVWREIPIWLQFKPFGWIDELPYRDATAENWIDAERREISINGVVFDIPLVNRVVKNGWVSVSWPVDNGTLDFYAPKEAFV